MNHNQRIFIPDPDIEKTYKEMILYYRKLESIEAVRPSRSLSNTNYTHHSRSARIFPSNVLTNEDDVSLSNSIVKTPQDTPRRTLSSNLEENSSVILPSVNTVNRTKRANSGLIPYTPVNEPIPVITKRNSMSKLFHRSKEYSETVGTALEEQESDKPRRVMSGSIGKFVNLFSQKEKK